MKIFRLMATTALSGVALTIFAAPVLAQQASTQAPQEQETELNAGDIIVTATKRAQALSDVPIAVSAVSGEQLQASGVTDIRALQTLSPSLVLTSSASEAAGTVARLRGVGTTGDNPGLESAVAIFIDGVFRSRNNIGLTELGEVERIEVLRGPQGTLFGRNASAGLINVITKRPQFEFGGYADATFGNFNAIRLAGGITGPIIGDKLAGRLDVVYFKRDGFFKDAVTGDDYNNRNRYLIRGQLLAAPTDTLEIRFIADYSNRKEDCCAAAVLVRGPTAGIIEGLGGRLGSGGPAGTNTFDRVSATTPGISFQTDVEEFGFSAEANLDLDAFKITSITAYRDFEAIRGQDTDFTSLSILERADGGQFQEFRTFSQELRLNGTAFADRLDYLFGFFYSNEKIRFEDQGRFGRDALRFANCIVANGVVGAANLDFAAPGCIRTSFAMTTAPTSPVQLLAGLQPGLGVGGLSAVNIAAGGSPTATLNLTGQNDRHRQTSNNFAFFTHNVFTITDRLSLTLGGRFTRDKKEYSSILESNNTFCTTIATAANTALRGFATLPCVFNSLLSGVYSNDRTENRFSGTAVVSFKATDDLLTYASYSRGYKGGGFNLDRSGLALNSTLMGNGTFNLLEPITSTNPNVTRDTLQFEEEVVDAYEVGAKFSNPFISVNFAAFYQKFTNFQLNTFNGINFIVANLPEVVSQGFELEAFTSPVDNLTLSVGFTLADAKYGDNLVTPLSGSVFAPPTPANPAGGALFRLPGQRITNAPQYTFSGSLGYKLPIGNTFELLFNSDIRYQSAVNSGSDLDIEKVQEGFALVNGRIGIGTQDGKYSAEFFVRNLFDVDTTQVNFDGPLQGSGGREALINTQTFNAFLGDPRTFGVTVRAKF